MRSRWASAGLVVAAALLSGCTLGTVSREELDEAYPMARLTTLSAAGMEPALRAFRDGVGGKVRATSLSFSQGVTTLTAQNPRETSNFDTYSYVNGGVSKRPVTLRGDDEQQMKARLFDLESVPFDQLRGAAKKALTELAIPGAHVAHVSVDLQKGKLVVQVNVASERRSGRVVFDAQGKVLSAQRD